MSVLSYAAAAIALTRTGGASLPLLSATPSMSLGAALAVALMAALLMKRLASAALLQH